VNHNQPVAWGSLYNDPFTAITSEPSFLPALLAPVSFCSLIALRAHPSISLLQSASHRTVLK